ncbi:unnamed protein product [Allacma fusca]|uniref:ODAD1 central coiled coil region domain-containing protein n=1 Tax=Allacma fusca TaxID=39272 RepID=A0A8J2L5X2_9HEXA|nr:unnamed protein product [Allacma fusca]
MAKKAADSESEVNFEILARKELAQLQRQYRVMETDRQTYIQGKGRNANRQGKMLEYLRNEREDLIVDISNALSIANVRKDKESENIIVGILQAYFRCVEEIQAQLEEITEMEAQVDKTTKHVIAQRLKAQAVFGRSMTVAQSRKRLRILENRKYHATTLFDSKVTENGLLRADINLSLMERGRFHERYRKLKKQIAAVKHKMLIVVDNALTTYEGREEAVMKIHMLRERNDKESQQHVLEIKEYQRVFHHDQKLRAFMEVKNRVREVVERSEDRKCRITLEKEKQLDDLIRQYKKSFAQLLNLAQTKDVETLLNQYLTQEQSNFTSFKYITDLNNEACVLEDAIRKLKHEIEEAAQKAKKTRKEQDKSLRSLNKEFEKSHNKLGDLLVAWDDTEDHMNKIIHGVDVIFDLAGCQNAPVIQLLGNRSGILPRNLCLCLKVLEHRILELQHNKGLLEVKKAIIVDRMQLPVKQGLWSPGKKPPPTGGPFKPKVILTGQLAGDVDDDDEESEKQLSMRPMTYQEIKEFYKSKMLETQPAPLATDLDEAASNLQLESVTSIPTKPKFGPPIKPIPDSERKKGESTPPPSDITGASEQPATSKSDDVSKDPRDTEYETDDTEATPVTVDAGGESEFEDSKGAEEKAADTGATDGDATDAEATDIETIDADQQGSDAEQTGEVESFEE